MPAFSHRPLLGGIALLCACVLLSLTPGARSRAQKSTRTEAPQVLQTPLGTTEVGMLAGAQYRIDIPNGWNGSLVVFYHGYAEHGTVFHIAERLRPALMNITDRHYALAQSAYSERGWALEQAYPETEALRHYFERKYHTHETYVAGESMGGALVMITLELNPKPFAGGLDLCGSVGPTFVAFDRRFALRAAFDHYFPGLLGPLVPVPPDYDDTAAVREKILSALRANPTEASQLRDLTGLHTDLGVANDMAYFTYVIADMQRRARGNPFDNRNWIYSGTSTSSSAEDEELNAAVRRYQADPKAREYLMRHYTPNGRIGRPMLALHTVYDPVVPAAQLALYNGMVLGAGQGDRFVQQFVPRDGHCALRPDEIGRAFDELVSWSHGGHRPMAGPLR